MVKPTDPRAPATAREKRWALVRMFLGQAQMAGAIVSAYLLYQTGFSTVSLSAVLLATAFTATSLLLFRGRRSR